jgi:aminopeptidase
MADTRLQRLAQVLVRYSLGIKKGDRFAIFTGPVATPLVQEVVREALRAGGLPETFVSFPGLGEIVLREGSDEQLSYIPRVVLPGEHERIEWSRSRAHGSHTERTA